MADDLEILVRSIEAEPPSSEPVATLREHIAAEIAAAADVTDEPVVEIDLRLEAESSTRRPTRWILAGLAAAIVLIVGFVSLSGGGDEGGIETTDTPPETSNNVDGNVSQEQASSSPMHTLRRCSPSTPRPFPACSEPMVQAARVRA